MKKLFNHMNSAAVGAALLLQTSSTRAADLQLLHGHVPAAVARLQPLRHFNGTNHLHLAIGLPWRDKPGLTNLLEQIYDPASPNFHQFLTPAQFAERFGPSLADYQALIAFATSNHLVLKGTHRNRMLLDVDGTVSDVEKAFHTTMQVYQHPTEKREFYAPDTEPSVDLNLPILHISGLDNYVLPHPNIVKMQDLKNPLPANQSAPTPASGSGPGGTFLGYDFRTAYVPNVALTGTGQSVGLLEFDSGYVQSDITTYETLAGLPNVPVIPVLLDGYNGAQGIANDEVSLDIEMAIAMAPGLNNVAVYEGEITDDILNRMATDDSSKELSASWTYPIDAASDQIFQEFGVQGQSFFNASGDDDAYVGTIPTPADDPYVTVVGGTELTTSGPFGVWTGESVWNERTPNPNGGDWGSSGGISTVYTIPSWQLGISMTANQGSTTYRNLPDVALTADNIWITYGGGFAGGVGGTSAATPLWAAFCALVNQQGEANGLADQGFINPSIYAIGKSNIYASCFHDTIAGDNTWSGSPNVFFAVPGYDLCTGWGTPSGSNLINALAPVSIYPVLNVFTNVISGGNGNGVIDFDECNNLSIVLTNQGGGIATGISATLYSTTSNVIVAKNTSTYPDLLPHNSSASLNSFTISTEPGFVCGTPVDLTLVVKYDQGIKTNLIQLPSGVFGTPDRFVNATQFTIPTTFTPVNSPVTVSGLDSVGKLTVSVYLAAQYDLGLSLALISPNGTQVILAEGDGGYGQNYGIGCATNTATTFDDAATTPITTGTAPFVGSFQPLEPLSVFNLTSGSNLDGVWNLQVLDEFPGDTATLLCWSLNVSPEVCVDGGGQCPGADLSLTMSAAPNPVFVNSNLTYSLIVSNGGPGPADNTVIVQSLPPGAGFVTTSNSAVSVSQTGSTLNMSIGSLQVYQTATVYVITTNTIPGYITSQATVGSQDLDPNTVNNSASVSTLVTPLTADVGVTMKGAPASVLQGGLLTYTINVTNNGPFPANGVSLSTILPTTVNFVSATSSQGTVSFGGTVGTLGTIGTGTNVIVTIVVSPTVTGNIIASTVASISSMELDPIAYNNTASVQTTVGPAADISVTAFAYPSPVVAGSNFSYFITVSNAGPSAATGIVFSQTIPSGVTSTNITSSLPGATIANNSVTGTIASLAAGSSILITDTFTSPTLLQGVHSQLMTSTLSAYGQPGDENTNNNVFALQTFAEPPTISIVPAGATIISGSSNGAIGPTGTYTVEFFLLNEGNIPTSHLVATLENSNGVIFSSGSQTYGALTNDAPTATGEDFTFTANSTNGGTIIATLQLQDGTNNLGAAAYTFVMPTVQSFSSTNFISLPSTNDIPEPDSGPASPYPSTIVVSNVNGDVSDVSVTLSNMIHSYPNDLGVMLVGPSGQACVLMAAAGSNSEMLSPAVVTFDQYASLIIPSQGQIVTGSYRPADYNQSYTFSNSPAPVGPYNTNLANFESLSANGTWSLYIYDNVNGDAGAISNGWSLKFTTITPVSQVADLAASITTSASAVTLSNTATLITNVWTVTNNGPNTALQTLVTNILSPGLSLVTNIVGYGVSNTLAGQTNIFNLGNVTGGTGLAVTSIVMAVSPGWQTNLITATSPVLDANLANNTASVAILVAPPLADLSVGPIFAAPNPVVVTNPVVLTLFVTNNGPSYASNVIGVFTFPSSLGVQSNGPSQGIWLANSTTISNFLGTIPSGQFAVVTVVATPQSAGILTNTWTVTTSGDDTVSTNNATTNLLTVVLPAPVITNGGATLLSQSANGSITFGSTNSVSFTLLNIGTGSTANLVATLATSGGITPIGTSSNVYGSILPGGSTSQTYQFLASGAAGATVTATLALRDGTTNLGTVSYPFLLAGSHTFTNSGAIVIPDYGPATPYPSVIQVSSLTNNSSDLLVSGVSATLNGFTHSFPHDVEAVLVSPDGLEVVLMEHTGGPYSVSGLNLTFADSTTNMLSESNQIGSGTYAVSTYAPFDVFPGLSPVPSASTNLAYFNGTDANGVWSLYVYDDTPGNAGDILNGWTLNLTTVEPVNPAARLIVSSFETPSPATGGNYIYYQVTVYNLGPDVASNVFLTNTLSAGTVFSDSPVTVSQGSYSLSGQSAICNLGSITAGSSAVITVQAIAATSGSIVNTAVASTTSADLYLPDSTNITITPIDGTQAAYLSAAVSGGGMQLSVDGSAGQTYIIQISTNLTKWYGITTNIGSFTYRDTMTNATRCFYRAVKVPQ